MTQRRLSPGLRPRVGLLHEVGGPTDQGSCVLHESPTHVDSPRTRPISPRPSCSRHPGPTVPAQDSVSRMAVSGPPRARGCRTAPPGQHRAGTSTPACAELPVSASSSASALPLYPRVRGAARAGRWRSGSVDPLPPRARGCQILHDLHIQARPSTPACAGLPRDTRRRTTESYLYPRVRGAA